MKLSHTILAIAAALALFACAKEPTDPAELAEFKEANDPAEPTNRAIFSANYFLDRNLLQPVARAYSDTLPDGARKTVHNFVSNIGEPVVLMNDLLQGNTDKAWTTTRRFAVNTTIGAGGLIDLATGWDLDHHPADFGQTLGVWGIDPGPSVQLPLFGFSNVRDSVGLAFNAVTNPLNFIPGAAMSDITIASGGLGLVNGRAEALPVTDDLERTSLDYYAVLRTIAAKHRADLVKQGLSDEPRPEDPQRM